MGMKFRKSINLGGGTRLNVSRSGVGVSTGVKGFRVSTNTSGRSRVTASLPGSGLSYTKEYGSSGSSGNSQSAPAHHSHGSSSAPSGGGDKPPFFQRPGVIILCLLLFAPLGIFLMWRYIPQWKTGMKVALSILFGLVFICALVPKAGDNVADVDQPPAVRQQVEGTKTPAKIQKPAADEQEPQDAAEAVTGTETKTDDAAAQEPVQTPQETQQAVVVQPEDPPKQEQPKQEQAVQQEEFKDEERTVYITPTGTKYHSAHCRTIKDDKTEININDAIARGYTACKVCGG